ncbi:MAG: DNA polymerase III subunit epsilon [Desulfuromonas sp.]|nr:MAG: DNA polymerase III subunit epsilon [Desulfuromonas sp.]
MPPSTSHQPFIVLDFETSGMSPQMGDRAIEVGAVRVERGEIVARFQSLMNPGFRVNAFIENYTGISNEMLAEAPGNAEVMSRFADFISADVPLVAHNASFDKRFLEHELRQLSLAHSNPFGCSMLVARRIYPDAPNHKLGTLVAYKQLRNEGVFHRALADAEMTAHLWLQMLEDLRQGYAFADIPFQLMCDLAKVKRESADGFLRRMAENASF